MLFEKGSKVFQESIGTKAHKNYVDKWRLCYETLTDPGLEKWKRIEHFKTDD